MTSSRKFRRGKHGISVNFHFDLRLLVFSLLTMTTAATVVVPQFNVSYPSMPAMFGRKWPEDKIFTAHLQMIADRPLLCEEAVNDMNGEGGTLTAPSDGIPVVLLAKRGECTFFEKSAVASTWDFVHYLVVYDNEMSQQLVPMSSEYPSDIALLFISYHSGMELRDLIMQQMRNTSVSAQDGILIEMDAASPVMSAPIPELTFTGYMLAAMTGLLAFLIFCGGVLLCAQAGIITAHPDERGRIVLFAGGSGPRQVAMRIISNGLLTEEQISDLDAEVFQQPIGVDDAMCCCAICLDEFETGETVRKLPCEHKFHDLCLIPWLTERHSSCPLCKFDVLEHIISKRTDSSTEEESVEEDTDCSSCWMRLRELRGWTLLGRHDVAQEDASNRGDTEEIHLSEIEMETTTIRN